MAFPAASHQDTPDLEAPTVTHGHIVAVAPDLQAAAANPHAGTQVGATYHPDSTQHVPLQPIEDQPPQDQIDKDRASMWPVRHLKQESANGGSKRRRTAAADAASMAEEFDQLPLHDTANTQLKDQLALYRHKQYWTWRLERGR
eukprot:TRINITY_DN5574_c0_g2_i1.p1 TRINITY_DN5574_c0_g2~~TRINITY_DN5574_c0_g2_i1.p1  ORF type:complete len:144 (-),score=18.62 TRINITY_DN5574_c0_g2_i1:100-531(-)